MTTVKIWQDNKSWNDWDAQHIKCSGAILSNDNNTLLLSYLNDSLVVIPMKNISRVDIIQSESKSCPTCFRLLEEENKDE